MSIDYLTVLSPRFSDWLKSKGYSVEDYFKSLDTIKERLVSTYLDERDKDVR
jgi:hypothetical protein